MFVSRNTKYILVGAALLVVIAGCSVAVARAITDKDNNNNLYLDEPKTSSEIVQGIQNLMKDTSIVGQPIQAYIIPSVDAHQSEYISVRDQRIKYVSSFSGSAGTVIISSNKALLWTDSRYHLQAEDQIDSEVWTLMKQGNADVQTTREWLLQNLPPNSLVGIDPFLIDSTEFDSLSGTLSSGGHLLVSIADNLVDIIWTNKPELNLAGIVTLDIKYSGKTINEKLTEVRNEIKKLGAETFIVTALDEIAWFLNLRGLDIGNNPVFYSYLIISLNNIELYLLDISRATSQILAHFAQEGVEVKIKEYDSILNGIQNIIDTTSGHLLLARSSLAIYSAIPSNRRITRSSPINLMKVIKNEIEAEGMRNAHIRDGTALIRYLHWLNRTVDEEVITELSGAAKLREFRSIQENFRGLSFNSISAFGSHGAIVHYGPTEETDRQITRDEMYLIDSGGQYWDGTTDVTRTVHMGTPTDAEKEAFTRVLKGFIALNTAKFPPKTPFSFFDALARRPLYDIGLSYGHGTGHGIGSYLNVHEYPPLISSASNEVGMQENMFFSDEPGYYEAGNYGIRIEDVIQSIKSTETLRGDFEGQGVLEFYDVTMAPIQTKLINTDLITKDEATWLNSFHLRIRNTVGPRLISVDDDAYSWLLAETQPISYNRNL